MNNVLFPFDHLRMGTCSVGSVCFIVYDTMDRIQTLSKIDVICRCIFQMNTYVFIHSVCSVRQCCLPDRNNIKSADSMA
jgi:hypothetical protein